MRKPGFLLILVYAGCFNICTFHDRSCPGHASSGGCGEPDCDCPLVGELPHKNGTSCLGTAAPFCTDGNYSCSCYNPSNVWECSSPDLSRPIPSPPDQTIPLQHCAGYVDCLENCLSSQINPNLATCTSLCKPTTTVTAVAKYEVAVQCGEQHCVGDLDAANGRCHLGGDGGTTLLNEDDTPLSPTDTGTGQKRCALCLSDTLAALYQATCTQLSSPDCNPVECVPQVLACLTD